MNGRSAVVCASTTSSTADIIGEASAEADAELIALCIDLLRAFGFTADDVVVRISDREFWIDFLRTQNVPEERWQSVARNHRQERTRAARENGGAARRARRRLSSKFSITAARARSSTALSPACGSAASPISRRSICASCAASLTTPASSSKRSIAAANCARSPAAVATTISSRHLSDGAASLPALGFAMGDVVLGELIKRERGGARADGSGGRARADSSTSTLSSRRKNAAADALTTVQALRDAGYRVDYPLTAAKVGKQFQNAEQLGARVRVALRRRVAAGEGEDARDA